MLGTGNVDPTRPLQVLNISKVPPGMNAAYVDDKLHSIPDKQPHAVGNDIQCIGPSPSTANNQNGLVFLTLHLSYNWQLKCLILLCR